MDQITAAPPLERSLYDVESLTPLNKVGMR